MLRVLHVLCLCGVYLVPIHLVCTCWCVHVGVYMVPMQTTSSTPRTSTRVINLLKIRPRRRLPGTRCGMPWRCVCFFFWECRVFFISLSLHFAFCCFPKSSCFPRPHAMQFLHCLTASQSCFGKATASHRTCESLRMRAFFIHRVPPGPQTWTARARARVSLELLIMGGPCRRRKHWIRIAIH